MEKPISGGPFTQEWVISVTMVFCNRMHFYYHIERFKWWHIAIARLLIYVAHLPTRLCSDPELCYIRGAARFKRSFLCLFPLCIFVIYITLATYITLQSSVKWPMWCVQIEFATCYNLIYSQAFIKLYGKCSPPKNENCVISRMLFQTCVTFFLQRNTK